MKIGIWVEEVERLFRPVGVAELELIAAANYAAFPPRLPEQPIFYPVCNQGYAREIATKWNAKEERAYVTVFDVAKSFIEHYERHQVGNKEHVEYWIPASDLPDFNKNLVGKIQILESTEPEVT